MSRGGARRRNRWRRDLRLVSKYLRHDAAPFKDCTHEDVRWTFSATSLPAIQCQDCGLMATGGSVVMARGLAAAGGTPPKPPAKSPKGISEASSIEPLLEAFKATPTNQQAATIEKWGHEATGKTKGIGTPPEAPGPDSKMPHLTPEQAKALQLDPPD